jgi:AraC family transcriptional regulator
MEWIERLNQAINYIEEYITKELNYGQIAKVAGCSTYHFQRMFAYIADVPLSEYIRRRRMSLAVADLQGSERKIIDVALKYGYTSPTAFNRAFRSVHNIAPSLVKKGGVILRAYPPINFKITVKGVEELDYRLEKKEAFRIVGISQSLHKDIEKNFEIVPQMWQKAVADGTIPRLVSMMGASPMGLLGVSICNDDEEWKYFIAVSNSQSIDNSLEEYLVPASTWAVFPGSGTNKTLQELERRIFTEWLPASGYEYANGPDIEVYLNADPQNAQYEVWIPIK